MKSVDSKSHPLSSFASEVTPGACRRRHARRSAWAVVAALLGIVATAAVAAASTVALTSDVYPSIWLQPVTFTATVTPPSATGTVTFRDSLTFMGTASVSGGVAQLVKSNLFPGRHGAITATYNGDGTNAPA